LAQPAIAIWGVDTNGLIFKKRLYDAYAEAGVTDVYHTGNYIDGEAKFNFADIHTHGLDQQFNTLQISIQHAATASQHTLLLATIMKAGISSATPLTSASTPRI
jgi:hypothetical protein